MSEMGERIAKRLFEDENGTNGPWNWDQLGSSLSGDPRDKYRRFARLAIEELEKPTQAMVDVGQLGGDISKGQAIDCWQSMIDEALK